jgi:hypothetical protein
LLRGEPDDERRAEAYTGVLRNVQTIKEMVVVPDAELHKKLRSLMLRTDERPVTTAAQLMAKGDMVTMDIAPIYEREAGVADADDLEVDHPSPSWIPP